MADNNHKEQCHQIGTIRILETKQDFLEQQYTNIAARLDSIDQKLEGNGGVPGLKTEISNIKHWQIERDKDLKEQHRKRELWDARNWGIFLLALATLFRSIPDIVQWFFGG